MLPNAIFVTRLEIVAASVVGTTYSVGMASAVALQSLPSVPTVMTEMHAEASQSRPPLGPHATMTFLPATGHLSLAYISRAPWTTELTSFWSVIMNGH